MPASRPSRCWNERRATARRSCTVLSAATGSSRVCATCPRTATGARQRSLDEAPRAHPWRRLRRARTGDATVREPRGRRPSHAGGPQRLLLLRYSKLDFMLGRLVPADVRLYYRDFAKDGVEFRQETVTGIEPATRRVTTDAGSYDPDFLVVALGADYDMAATPGLAEGGSE